MSNLITEAEHEALVERASELGKEHGHNVGTWVIVNDDDTARALLRMEEDGDPEFDDAAGYRSPLSGEWADDLTPSMLLVELAAPPMDDGEEHDVVTAYEQAHYEAFKDEALRMARAQLD